MSPAKKLFTAPFVAIVLIAVTALPADALDNLALAINTKDDFYKSRVAFQVTRVDDDVVDDANLAFADSSCERCRTAAVAVQILLITGDPSTAAPRNFAIAQNIECTMCRTYAGAWQLVVTTGRPVHFTESGNATIDAVREQVRLLVETAEFGPTEDEVADLAKIDALNAAIDAQVSKLELVVQEEIVLVGGGRVSTIEVTDLAA